MCCGGVLLFGATLVCSAPGMMQGACPTGVLPALLLLLPCMPQTALKGKEWQQVGEVVHQPCVGPTQASGRSLVGPAERVKDAQGNTGLSCPQDPPSALQSLGVWQYQELGVPAAHTPDFSVSHC